MEEISFKDFGRHLFQRFWMNIVSKILEENCFTDFGGNLFQRFWTNIVSKILEENCFKELGGKLFQRFWRISLVLMNLKQNVSITSVNVLVKKKI